MRNRYKVIVKGIEGTSGADFYSCRSAIVESCSFILKLMNSFPEALVEEIEGGKVVSNVPGKCAIIFSSSANLAEIELFIKTISEKPLVPDTDYQIVVLK